MYSGKRRSCWDDSNGKESKEVLEKRVCLPAYPLRTQLERNVRSSSSMHRTQEGHLDGEKHRQGRDHRHHVVRVCSSQVNMIEEPETGVLETWLYLSCTPIKMSLWNESSRVVATVPSFRVAKKKERKKGVCTNKGMSVFHIRTSDCFIANCTLDAEKHLSGCASLAAYKENVPVYDTATRPPCPYSH